MFGRQRSPYLEFPLNNVNKPSVSEGILHNTSGDHVKGPAELLARLDVHLAPLVHGAALFYGAVIRLVDARHLKGLDIAAGFATPVGLFQQATPVRDRAEKVAHVDVIEVVCRIDPVLRCVVQLEAHIRRDPGWLVGRDVSANHRRVGKLIGTVTAGRDTNRLGTMS